MTQQSPYPISILDLATVREGQSIGEAVNESVKLAQIAEKQGFKRIWYAEHHNMPKIASSATSVLLAHVAAHTSTIRLGSGGIMLPNHSPLVIAEQFGMLNELYGDRIDLGLGRAPGTDQQTLRALRRSPESANNFPSDVVELQGYLKGETRIPGINAYPGKDTNVPLYILGSSHFGAQLGAELGLSYSFASHFAPQMLESASKIYRERFKPSEDLEKPHFIAALNVVVAETNSEAQQLWEATKRERIRMMMGRGRQLSDEDVEMLMHSPGGQQVLEMAKYTAVGTPDVVRDYLDEFAERVQADELMITNAAPGIEARERALELLGEHVVNR